MIDGIKIYYGLQDFQKWKEDTGIRFKVTTDLDTGEIKQITGTDKKTGLPYTSIEHRARFETYQITVNEITHTGKKPRYDLTIKGSLHKNHFKGSNFSRFTFPGICSQIHYLCHNLHLNAAKCVIKNFEYGLNLSVEFNPIECLEKNLISYKGKPFYRLKTENETSIGFDSRLGEYRIKVYDKGLQHKLPQHLMRFEKAYKKMTSPKKMGIYTLTDLTKVNIFEKLQGELLQAWDEVLLFDDTVLKNANISEKDKIFLLECRTPQFFKNFESRTTRGRKRDKFKKLLLKYGSNGNIHNEVRELLENEFQKCMGLSGTQKNEKTETGTLLPGVENEVENRNRYNLTVNIEGHSVPPVKRHCKGCGKELHPNQKKSSSFCSAKFVGYNKAHQCRNIYYNPANNFKKKLISIDRNGVLFDINPYFSGKGISYK